MSSPKSSHSQFDPSLTSDVHTLITSFSSLSIESHGEKQWRAKRELKEGEFLLNDEVYISATRVIRKRQYTFSIFAYSEEVIRKSDNTTSWLCGLYKKVERIQLYSSTSTAWMGKHLIKRHNLSSTIAQSSSSLVSQTKSTTPAIVDNARSPFIATTPEQYSNFNLTLITWMVKRHISYSQVEDDTFWQFVANCSMGAISAESILPYLGNTI